MRNTQQDSHAMATHCAGQLHFITLLQVHGIAWHGRMSHAGRRGRTVALKKCELVINVNVAMRLHHDSFPRSPDLKRVKVVNSNRWNVGKIASKPSTPLQTLTSTLQHWAICTLGLSFSHQR